LPQARRKGRRYSLTALQLTEQRSISQKDPRSPLLSLFWRPTPRRSEEKLLHLCLVLFRREIARETHFTKILFHRSFPAHLDSDMHRRRTFMTIVTLHFYFSNVLNPFLISDHPGISALTHWLLVPNWNGMTFHLNFRPVTVITRDPPFFANWDLHLDRSSTESCHSASQQ
jgi:hypothetical protein